MVRVWTIGYGNADRIQEGDRTTEAAADAWLRARVEKTCSCITESLDRPLTQGQMDALASFAYNNGLQALRGSTLWKKLRAGDLDGAAAEFPKWRHAGGREIPGLARRRAQERDWFEQAA